MTAQLHSAQSALQAQTLFFTLSHHISTVVNVFLSMETLESKSYDLSAHCPRHAAV